MLNHLDLFCKSVYQAKRKVRRWREETDWLHPQLASCSSQVKTGGRKVGKESTGKRQVNQMDWAEPWLGSRGWGVGPAHCPKILSMWGAPAPSNSTPLSNVFLLQITQTVKKPDTILCLLKNKTAAQAAGADPYRCNSTNGQYPPLQ